MKKTTFVRAQGFSLIELLIVMAILGMLAGLVGPRLIDIFSKNKPKAAATQISAFTTALETHKLDVGKYPKTLEGLLKNTSGKQTWGGPYLSKNVIPKDPWDNPYQYRTPGRNNKDFDLYSYGADGREGGSDEDADVTNWQ